MILKFSTIFDEDGHLKEARAIHNDLVKGVSISFLIVLDPITSMYELTTTYKATEEPAREMHCSVDYIWFMTSLELMGYTPELPDTVVEMTGHNNTPIGKKKKSLYRPLPTS